MSEQVLPRMPTPEQLLSQPAPIVKFEDIGDKVVGQIVDMQTFQARDFGTNRPLFWEDGRPRYTIQITIKTVARDEFDGERRIYVDTGKQVYKAFKDAIAQAGVRTAQIGALLTVEYARYEQPKDGKGSPQKIYEVTYKPQLPEQ